MSARVSQKTKGSREMEKLRRSFRALSASVDQLKVVGAVLGYWDREDPTMKLDLQAEAKAEAEYMRRHIATVKKIVASRRSAVRVDRREGAANV